MTYRKSGLMVKTPKQIAILALLIFFSWIPLGHAADLNECMINLMKTASDEMTLGQAREKCRCQIEGVVEAASASEVVDNSKAGAVSERLDVDNTNVLKPFTLMSHKPNYILFAAHNASGYDSAVYERQYPGEDISFDDTEAQFQISIKTPLAVNLFDSNVDIYAAYTNRSFWQVYNGDISRPFRETNHEPEAWVQFRPENWEWLGIKNTTNSIGIVHQSNGKAAYLSRSWNRIFANFVIEKGNFAIGLKPWYRIPEDDEDDDNPDITDYLGHGELRIAYTWDEHVFSVMLRNNLESSFSRGAVEGSWSFPLWNYKYLKGYVQYFSGYGESLIDYNHYVNRIGVGFSLTDFL